MAVPVMRQLFLVLLLTAAVYCDINPAGLTLSTVDSSISHAIQGFATEIQCVLNSCLRKPETRVKWYRHGQQLFVNESIYEHSWIVDKDPRIQMSHFVGFQPEEALDCNHSMTCDDSKRCPDGMSCLDNACCKCAVEDFTLHLKNLSIADSGGYRCDLDEGSQSLEFQLVVIESGLSTDFHKNLTFDHSACCREQQMSQKCSDMCQPSVLETHHFDPLGCQAELPKFLHCATEGGNRSHEHCCRMQLVPPFCWEFCSGTFTQLKDAHRVCLYWLPEILQCYERAYLPFPEPPRDVVVNVAGADKLDVCWIPPPVMEHTEHLEIHNYTVHYKMVPRFPFFGGGPGSLPFLPSTELSIGDGDDMENADHASPLLPVHHNVGKRSAMEDSEFESSSDLLDLGGGFSGQLKLRKKRQTWIFVTHNRLTNETSVREFKFEQIYTSNTCVNLTKLRPATQYYVYVTATNDYGTSLPSVRGIAETGTVKMPSEANLRKIEQCCRDNGVSEDCFSKVCNLNATFAPHHALEISLNCRSEFSKVGPCLADGRNHRPCCESRMVSGECLNLCDGTTKFLGLSSVMCLTLDMNTVFSCIKEGYVTHPSPPRNVRVTDVLGSAATVAWDPPADNHDKVISYSLFHRRDDRLAQSWIEVNHVNSPHLLGGLEPNYPYMVYVVAHTDHGSSLNSTIQEFFTTSPDDASVCPFGRPIMDVRGEMARCQFGERKCPPFFTCTRPAPSLEYCCPTDPTAVEPTVAPKLPDIRKCCERKQVKEHCLDLCRYNVTFETILELGPQCYQHASDWIDCGADGRDHVPCCAAAGVTRVCQAFCRPPLGPIGRQHLDCVKFVQPILRCGVEGVLKLPGPPRHTELLDNEKEAVIVWSKPSQTQEVTHYEVFLYSGGALAQVKNVTDTSVTFSNVTKGRNYTVNVRSWNEHGSSIPGNNVTFSSGSILPVVPGKGELPLPPNRVHEVWNTGDRVNISWSWARKRENGGNVTNFTYKLHYAEETMEVALVYKSKSSHKSWHVLDLLEFRTYLIHVTVIDLSAKPLESRQSETIVVSMVKDARMHGGDPPEISFDPPLPSFKENDSSTAVCKANGATTILLTHLPRMFATRIINTVNGTDSARLKFKFTPENDRQVLECEATYGAAGAMPPPTQLRTSVTLQVQFKPRLSAYGPVNQTIVEAHPVEFECGISGFPRPSFSWFFSREAKPKLLEHLQYGATNANAGQVDNRHMFSAKSNNAGSYSHMLQLSAVLIRDTGYYYCKACNALGCAQRRFNLTVVYHAPPAPMVDDMKACCKEHKVPSDCQPYCSYDIDIDNYLQKPKCLKEVSKIIYCAQAKGDHTDCCAMQRVPPACLTICNSTIGYNQKVDLEQCSRYSEAMVFCVAESRKQLPPPVTTIEASKTVYGDVRLTWLPPKDTPTQQEVTMYAVFFRPTEGNAPWKRTQSLTRGERSVVVSDLMPKTNYSFAVVAANQYGWSKYQTMSLITPDTNHWRAMTSHSSSGGFLKTALLTIFVLMLIAIVLVVGLTYVTRRSGGHPMPPIIARLLGSSGGARGASPLGAQTSTAVAFENPGYDREAQIRGLPGDPIDPVAGGEGGNLWQNAPLHSAPADTDEDEDATVSSEQKGMKYAKLN